MLEVQVGKVADSESRTLLKTVSQMDTRWRRGDLAIGTPTRSWPELILLTRMLTTDMDDLGRTWNGSPPTTCVSSSI